MLLLADLTALADSARSGEVGSPAPGLGWVSHPRYDYRGMIPGSDGIIQPCTAIIN